MPLSEHEQRILDEIERRLADEDPKFARSAHASTPRGHAVKRIKRAAAGFVVGVALLVSGLLAGPSLILPFGLAAFAVMLLSVLTISKGAKDLGRVPALHRRSSSSGWFDRMEERWRKRFDRDNGGS